MLFTSYRLPPAPPKVTMPVRLRILERYGKDITRCPRCGKGTMMLMETVRPHYDHRIIQQQKERVMNNAP